VKRKFGRPTENIRKDKMILEVKRKFGRPTENLREDT
jgi:hypothetical protein